MIVDSTGQEKAVAHPTDSKLLETARVKVVEAAKANGIELKQTYAKKAKHLVSLSVSRKAVDNRAKLYSWHAPEVECISKGKSRNPYEFGVKVGLAMALKGNLIVGARSFPCNPYDGHTMHEQIEQRPS